MCTEKHINADHLSNFYGNVILDYRMEISSTSDSELAIEA
jgi:hypothetical protein